MIFIFDHFDYFYKVSKPYCDESGPKLFDLGRVGNFFCFLDRVGSATSMSRKFPPSPKPQIFQFSHIRVKKMSLGQVIKDPDQWWVCPLFTAGQNYA